MSARIGALVLLVLLVVLPGCGEGAVGGARNLSRSFVLLRPQMLFKAQPSRSPPRSAAPVTVL